MKALRRNPTRILAAALVSAGAMGLGLLGSTGVDPIGEPFEAVMVFSRALSSTAVIGILYRLATPKSPRPVLVPVRV